MPGSRLRDDQRGKQGHRQEDRIDPLTWSLEPEVGFEPTTFRLRGRCFQSDRTAPVGFSLLTLDAASAWSGPDGTTRVDWMTIGMTKAHSILGQVARAEAPDAHALGPPPCKARATAMQPLPRTHLTAHEAAKYGRAPGCQ